MTTSLPLPSPHQNGSQRVRSVGPSRPVSGQEIRQRVQVHQDTPQLVSQDSQDVPKMPDVSQMQTTLLTSPASPASLASLASPTARTPSSTAVLAATNARIAQHEAAAHQLRTEANRLSEQVQHNAEHFAHVVACWRELLHQPKRGPLEATEFARLEHEIPALSQQIARLRGRWTDCVAAARTQEEAADLLRAQIRA